MLSNPRPRRPLKESMPSEPDQDLAALQDENARLRAAVDHAIADAVDRDDINLAETLNEMAEG